MYRIEMICYKGLDEIFENLDSFLSLAQNEPNRLNNYLLSFQRQCEFHKKHPIIDSENRFYAARDLSTKIILKYGIYGALNKVQVLQNLLYANRIKYLPIALDAILLEINEVLETLLIHKLPKLLELSTKGNIEAIICLLNQEDNMRKILGEDGKTTIFDNDEQTTLYTVDPKKKRKMRYDIYLRSTRRLNSDDFANRLVNTIIGKEEFAKQMGDLICSLTMDEKIYEQIHPSIISTLMSLGSRLISSKNQDDENLFSEINQDQMIIDMESEEPKLKLCFPPNQNLD